MPVTSPVWIPVGVGGSACLVLILLAWRDFTQRRLPNGLVLAMGGLFLTQYLVGQALPAPVMAHLAVGAATLLFCIVLVAIGGFGGGDAKLASVVMLWAGPAAAGTTLLLITQCGLLLALAGLAAQRLLPRIPPDTRRYRILSHLAPTPGVPYGIALSIGGLHAVWATLSMHA